MKKLSYIISIAAISLVVFAGSLKAQNDVTYLDAAPVDSSHMEDTIILDEGQTETESDNKTLVYGGIAVLVIAGVVVFAAIRKKKK